MNPRIYSVGQVNTYIKNMFSQDFMLNRISIKGEVSNCKYHTSGHIYFSLKDETGTLSCVMFAGQRKGLGFAMKNGDKVVAEGSVSVYERDGKYQLYARSITLEGAGLLYERYLALKKELEEMGMFSQEYKQPIPAYVKKVGIVTAPTGAAIQDIRNIAGRRNPYVQLILYPALVQGEGAKESIVKGIETLDAWGVDVIIVGRGGGSIEDLWAFNEEPVVRAIAASEIPVVSAVGHETDFTLSDFAADRRAATPSQAAELVVADADSYLRYVEELTARGERVLVHQLEQAQHKLQRLQGSWALAKPERWLEPLQQRTDMAMRQLQGRMESILQKRQHKFGLLAARLDALSPLTVLARGYSITKTDSGRALRSIADVRWGEELRTQVADGDVISVVQQVERREKQ